MLIGKPPIFLVGDHLRDDYFRYLSRRRFLKRAAATGAAALAAASCSIHLAARRPRGH